MGEQYKLAIFRDIHYRGTRDQGLGTRKLKTIYFWGWTPLLLGSQYIIDIMQEVEKYFDISELQEFSIECNPYPYSETLASVKHIIETYSHLPRIRFSFGIQSLDDSILQQSNRDCTFMGLQQFTQDILAIKESNVVYNFDFIAFGDSSFWGNAEESRKELIVWQWDPSLRSGWREWLQSLISSKTIDSFSLYTLELFAWAKRYHETKDPLIAYQAPWDHEVPFATSEDSILDQFDELKNLFLDWWYARYEISNYALPWKESIHNQVYWTMWEYIGIWLWAHGFVINPSFWEQGKESRKELLVWQWDPWTPLGSAQDDVSYFRTENTWWRKNYIQWPTEKTYKNKPCSSKDIMIESFFLWLRQQSGVANVSQYADILQNNRWEAIQKLVENHLAYYSSDLLQLTDQWMNIHHQVCTYLMKEI
jgi:coproporphyrinogen III oxidase-like Fe-S oxidoreductase